MQFHIPRKLMFMTRSYPSLLVSAVSATGLLMPALLYAASRRPQETTIFPIMVLTCLSSETSHWMDMALNPCFTSSSACWAGSLISDKTAMAPACANALAVVSQIPQAAPVTRVTSFFMKKSVFSPRFSYAVPYVIVFKNIIPGEDAGIDGKLFHSCLFLSWGHEAGIIRKKKSVIFRFGVMNRVPGYLPSYFRYRERIFAERKNDRPKWTRTIT